MQVQMLWLTAFCFSAGDLYFGELRLELREERLGNFLGRAVAFDPISALVLRGVIRSGGRSFCHRVGIDRVLDFLRELLLHSAPVAFHRKRLGDVFPIHDSITSHNKSTFRRFLLSSPRMCGSLKIIYNFYKMWILREDE